MRIIGVTGSSGAGKSTVCDTLKSNYDVKIIDADDVAKDLSKKGTNYISEIVKVFGQDILDGEGELKRKRLANIIYSNAQEREKLNQCTFKYIKEEIRKQINEEKICSTIIIDAPLLFESGLDKMCEKVLGVIADKNVQIERVMIRDSIDYETAKKRIESQESNEFYYSHCDEIIVNSNDMNYVKKCVYNIAEKWNITEKLQ